MSEQHRPPGIPDEAWRRWTTRTNPGAAPAPTHAGATRRVAVGDGDAPGGPCDLCGGEAAPFSWLSVDGAAPYALCASCRTTLARVARLAGPGPLELLV